MSLITTTLFGIAPDECGSAIKRVEQYNTIVGATLFGEAPAIHPDAKVRVVRFMSDPDDPDDPITKGTPSHLKKMVLERTKKKTQAYLEAIGKEGSTESEIAEKLNLQIRSVRSWLVRYEGLFVRRASYKGKGLSLWVVIPEGGSNGSTR